MERADPFENVCVSVCACVCVRVGAIGLSP